MIMSIQKKKRFKKLIQPQEVMVWFILPAIRREITNALIYTYSVPQKEIARRFGLTEPAISQYKKGVRGDIEFEPKVIERINDAARKIAEERILEWKKMLVRIVSILTKLVFRFDPNQ